MRYINDKNYTFALIILLTILATANICQECKCQKIPLTQEELKMVEKDKVVVTNNEK